MNLYIANDKAEIKLKNEENSKGFQIAKKKKRGYL